MKMQHTIKQLGFTLMELLIAIAIVAILAAIAVPTYLSYTQKAYFAEVVQTADQYKTAVSACLEQNGGVATSCDGGSNGIPANFTGATEGQVASVNVTDGVVVVTPRAVNGIAATDTYQLDPDYTAGRGIVWTASGGACTSGLASNCAAASS